MELIASEKSLYIKQTIVDIIMEQILYLTILKLIVYG